MSTDFQSHFSVRAPAVLLIRADAGGAIGAGHVLRMLALAQAWIERGGEAHLASRECPEALVDRLAREGVRHHHLAAGVAGSPADRTETAALARRCGATWIALDGYDHGLASQQELRDAGFRILAVDDYGHTATWCADLILNQNFAAADRSYANLVADGVQLMGPHYALLRREFLAAAAAPGPRAPRALRRILVTFGGVDAANVAGRVLAAFETAEVPTLALRVLAGPGNPHQARLAAQAGVSRHRLEVVLDCTDMPAMYRWADGVVSAAGSTCYEWLLFGRPAMVTAVAANQEPNAAWLRGHGAAALLPADGPAGPADWSGSLAAWVRDGAPAAPSGLVDARGAGRVADRLLALGARCAPEEVFHA